MSGDALHELMAEAVAGAEPGEAAPPAPLMGVYFFPEERTGLITMHESWAIDDGIACYGSFATRQEAEDAARRKGYRPVLMRDKPKQAEARSDA